MIKTALNHLYQHLQYNIHTMYPAIIPIGQGPKKSYCFQFVDCHM